MLCENLVNHNEKLFSFISKEIKALNGNGIGFNELRRRTGLSAPVLTKFRDNHSKIPNIESLEKLALGLKHPKSYYIDLLQFFDGQTTIDPRNPIEDDNDKPLQFDPSDDFHTILRPEDKVLFRNFEKLSPERQRDVLNMVKLFREETRDRPDEAHLLDDDI